MLNSTYISWKTASYFCKKSFFTYLNQVLTEGMAITAKITLQGLKLICPPPTVTLLVSSTFKLGFYY